MFEYFTASIKNIKCFCTFLYIFILLFLYIFILSLIPNFLRINFYFDKQVLEYLGQAKQDKTDKKTNMKLKVKPQEKDILNYCKEPRTLKEICNKFGFKDTRTFKKNYLNNLIDNGILQMTIPNQPRNKNQKYVIK